MALNIKKDNWYLILVYSPQSWIDYFNQHFSEFWNTESIGVKSNIFNFKKDDLLYPEYDLEDSKIIFILWRLENDYYRILNNILWTQYDILINKECNINEKYFFLGNNSFLLELERLSNQPIIIGWEKNMSIPEDIFIKIINSFPTKTELMHYSNARITNILSEYLEGVTDSQSKYERYLENRKKLGTKFTSLEWIEQYELEKYLFIRDTLKEMLDNYEKYSEKQWEDGILDIILILFPKYIKVHHSVPVIDYYTDPIKPKRRQIDLVLLDANLHIDIIEIKKPSYFDTVSEKPTSTRDNHIPMKNLSSAVMQVEKYIFHLSKWGRDWEKELLRKYGNEIQIVNPKWMLIMWRCDKLSKRQRFDFELIKRQYSNIIDIITYDDLMWRIDNIITKFSIKK